MPREEFRAILEKVWRKPDSARKFNAGRKLMDAALMFKTLVPGALYNLSDDQVEYQVRDRLSFLHYPTVVCPANHCRAMDNALAETINGLYKAEAEENYYAQKADPDMIA